MFLFSGFFLSRQAVAFAHVHFMSGKTPSTRLSFAIYSYVWGFFAALVFWASTALFTPSSPPLHPLPSLSLPLRTPISLHCSISHYGWVFAAPGDPPFLPPGGHGSIPSGAGVIPDPLHGFKTVRQIYELAVEEGTLKKYTVPILWDEKVCTRTRSRAATGAVLRVAVVVAMAINPVLLFWFSYFGGDIRRGLGLIRLIGLIGFKRTKERHRVLQEK